MGRRKALAAVCRHSGIAIGCNGGKAGRTFSHSNDGRTNSKRRGLEIIVVRAITALAASTGLFARFDINCVAKRLSAFCRYRLLLGRFSAYFV
jgi:hypothetical protein